MEIRVYDGLPEEAIQIRTTVFVEEQGFRDEWDEVDRIAVHLVAFDEGRAVGTCRVFVREGVEGYLIGRFAVLREYRKRGIGRRMLAAAEDYVREKGGTRLSLHSQCRAAVFYEKCGYVAYGDVEDEEGCPHIWMEKVLAREERA